MQKADSAFCIRSEGKRYSSHFDKNLIPYSEVGRIQFKAWINTLNEAHESGFCHFEYEC